MHDYFVHSANKIQDQKPTTFYGASRLCGFYVFYVLSNISYVQHETLKQLP